MDYGNSRLHINKILKEKGISKNKVWKYLSVFL